MLARSSTVGGLSSEALAKEDGRVARSEEQILCHGKRYLTGGNVLAALYSTAEGVWSADWGIEPPLKISDVMSNLFNKLATTYPFITVIHR